MNALGHVRVCWRGLMSLNFTKFKFFVASHLRTTGCHHRSGVTKFYLQPEVIVIVIRLARQPLLLCCRIITSLVLHGKAISELRGGTQQHDISEHTPPWPQPVKLVLDLPTPEGWKAECPDYAPAGNRTHDRLIESPRRPNRCGTKTP